MSDLPATSDRAADWLAGASIEPAVAVLRPDYRAVLVTVEGVVAGPPDEASEALLRSAEAAARQTLAGCAVEDVPHVAAWRDAYRAFGTKPQRFRSSLEQLLRRAESGLPRVNTLVDAYNATCVTWQIPVGGEDLDRYVGPPRLVRATGQERFDTVAAGEAVVEHPPAGEVVWSDEAGVTCRRWNWRQGRRTAITDGTTSAAFILDALAPVSDEAVAAAADDLARHLSRRGPDVRISRRLLRAPGTKG